MKLKLIKATDQNSTITVSDELFVKKINKVLVAQAVRVYLSNQRQGTSKTQTRSDVSRTGRKMYKQKGTGGARHGDKTATLFVGGAVAHGPRGIENWKKSLLSKMKRLAMKNVLTIQAKNIVITDEILKSNGKTKEAKQFLTKVGLADKKVVLVLPNTLPLVLRSFRNIKNVLIVNAKRLNVYEVALADSILITTEAWKILEQRLTVDKKESKAAKEQAKEPVKKTSVIKTTTKKAAAKSPTKITTKKVVAKSATKSVAKKIKAKSSKAKKAAK